VSLSHEIPVAGVTGPSVQRGGLLVGQISHLVLVSCLVKHVTMSAPEVVGLVSSLGPAPWVTLAGWEDPCCWEDLGHVVVGLHGRKYQVVVETQGTLWQEWLTYCDLVTYSLDPSSTAHIFSVAMLQKYHARLGDRLSVDVIVSTDDDLDFAARVRRIVPKTRVSLSTAPALNRAGTIAAYRWLVERVVRRPELRAAAILPRLDVLLGMELGR